jgi:hypothetical protein
MLATLAGPELDAAGPADEPPHAASVMATVARTIGNRFMFFPSPADLREREMKTLPEL